MELEFAKSDPKGRRAYKGRGRKGGREAHRGYYRWEMKENVHNSLFSTESLFGHWCEMPSEDTHIGTAGPRRWCCLRRLWNPQEAELGRSSLRGGGVGQGLGIIAQPFPASLSSLPCRYRVNKPLPHTRAAADTRLSFLPCRGGLHSLDPHIEEQSTHTLDLISICNK